MRMLPLPPEPLYVMKKGMSSIHCLEFHCTSGQERLYVGTQDGDVYIWDLKTNRPTEILHPNCGTCLSVRVIDDLLITQGKMGLVKMWINSKPVEEIDLEHVTFCKISVMSVNTQIFIVVPSSGSTVKLYVYEKELRFVCDIIPLSGMSVGEVMVIHIKMVSECMYVLAIYESGVLVWWRLHDRRFIDWSQITSETPMSLDFDGSRGVCGTNGKVIHVFDIDADGHIKISEKYISITNPGVSCLNIRSDKKILAAGCWDGKIRIFSWKTFMLLVVLESHRESILDLRFSTCRIESWNANRLIAAGSSDKTISLWKIYD